MPAGCRRLFGLVGRDRRQTRCRASEPVIDRRRVRMFAHLQPRESRLTESLDVLATILHSRYPLVIPVVVPLDRGWVTSPGLVDDAIASI